MQTKDQTLLEQAYQQVMETTTPQETENDNSMKLQQLANDWKEIQLQEKTLNERKKALASSTFDVISNTVGKEVAHNMYTLRHSTVPGAYQTAYRKLNRYPAEASPLNVLKLIKYVEANPVQ